MGGIGGGRCGVVVEREGSHRVEDFRIRSYRELGGPYYLGGLPTLPKLTGYPIQAKVARRYPAKDDLLS